MPRISDLFSASALIERLSDPLKERVTDEYVMGLLYWLFARDVINGKLIHNIETDEFYSAETITEEERDKAVAAYANHLRAIDAWNSPENEPVNTKTALSARAQSRAIGWFLLFRAVEHEIASIDGEAERGADRAGVTGMARAGYVDAYREQEWESSLVSQFKAAFDAAGRTFASIAGAEGIDDYSVVNTVLREAQEAMGATNE